jgi:transcription antitermination factor NusB
MRSRSKSREYALQLLYQADVRRAGFEQVAEAFWTDHQAPAEVRAYADRLVTGTLAHVADIDALISAHADNWALKRMAVIDRNILRLGAFELLYGEEAGEPVPAKVCLNEAIELAKRFGDTESGKFINGVLDAIHKRPHAQPHG